MLKTNLFEINLFDPMFTSPGLYEKVCLQNDKRYIGALGEYCLHRLGNPLKDLKNQTHHCQALQNDYNLYELSFKPECLPRGLNGKSEKFDAKRKNV
jgi:hypothetical protein